MKTDEEIEALEKQVAELKAECLRWAERWETHITGAFRAMEERAERSEAHLREAELGAYARRADIIALRDRAETAELERDEARAALKSAADALVALWGAIGDRLLAGGRLAREYANSVSEQCRSAERACRAAIWEKP